MTAAAPLRVLVLERSALYYGGARALVEWMRWFRLQGVCLDAILAEDGQLVRELSPVATVNVSPLPAVLDVYGGRLFSYGILGKLRAGLAWVWWSMATWWRFGAAFRRADVIVVNNTRTFAFFMLLLVPLRIFGKPIVWRIQIDSPIPRVLRKMCMRLSGLVGTTGGAAVARTIFTPTEWRQVSPRHIDCMNPLDYPATDRRIAVRGTPLERGPADIIVCCVAMLERRKRIHDLVTLAQDLRDIPGLRVEHVGGISDGTGEVYEAEIRASAQAAGLGSRFAMHGRREDFVDFLCQADIFVLPSAQEGVPFVIYEAMACALPVVATRVGGVADMVEDGESAFLVSPGDREALALRVRQLAADPALRHRMGKKGRARVVAMGGPEAHYREFLGRVAALAGRAGEPAGTGGNN